MAPAPLPPPADRPGSGERSACPPEDPAPGTARPAEAEPASPQACTEGPRARLGSRFHLVWTAVTVSGLGDGVRYVALPLLAARLSPDPRQIALVYLAEQAPWLLTGLPAGVLADRLDRRRLLYATDSARAVVAGALALAVTLHAVSIPLLCAVGFLLGCGQTTFNGAWSGVVPALVAPAARTRANARLQAGALITDTLLGPPAGAMLFALAPALPFWVDALSFAACASLLAVLRGDMRSGADPSAPANPRSLRSEVAAAVGWLWRHPRLRPLCLVAGISRMVIAGMIAVLVLFAREVLGLGGLGYSGLIAAYALGGLAATAAAPRLVARFGSPRVLRLAGTGSALAAIGAGGVSSALASGGFIACLGVTTLLWNITAISLQQEVVPSAMLGRVSMAYQMVSFGAGALGAALGGLLAGSLGLRAPFLAGGALLLATVICARKSTMV